MKVNLAMKCTNSNLTNLDFFFYFCFSKLLASKQTIYQHVILFQSRLMHNLPKSPGSNKWKSNVHKKLNIKIMNDPSFL